MVFKTCVVCNQSKQKEHFRERGRKCRSCQAEIQKNRINQNREEHNRLNRERYAKNKERYRATQRKYEQKMGIKARSCKKTYARMIFEQIRWRARKRSIPFNLTVDDVVIPEKCPVLGFELVRSVGSIKYNSASVDRIVPELGYVKGNIIVVSLKANMIKTNAKVEDIIKVAEFYSKLAGGINE
jgi:hypothetical protein